MLRTSGRPVPELTKELGCSPSSLTILAGLITLHPGLDLLIAPGAAASSQTCRARAELRNRPLGAKSASIGAVCAMQHPGVRAGDADMDAPPLCESPLEPVESRRSRRSTTLPRSCTRR